MADLLEQVRESLRVFTTPEVAKLTGATYRQIDHWDSKGWLRPCQPARGSGHDRLFDLPEVIVIAVAVGLGRQGVKADYALTHARRLVGRE
jgi:hypothetical protein